jgi:hypothetical protein
VAVAVTTPGILSIFVAAGVAGRARAVSSADAIVVLRGPGIAPSAGNSRFLARKDAKNDGLDRYFKVNMLFLLIYCLFCRQTGRLLSSFVIIGPHSAHRRRRNESFHVFTGSTTMTGI